MRVQFLTHIRCNAILSSSEIVLKNKLFIEMWNLQVNLLIFCALLVICEGGMTVDQMKKTAKVVRITCIQKTKISDDRVNELEKGDFPDARDLKCYTACLLEMMNTMKKGKVNYDAALKQVDVMMPDELKESTKATITTCRDVPKDYNDNCDASYAVFKCFFKNDPNFFFP